MAAMCASMKIFGHLYPYDDGDSYTNSDGTHEWYWYNSIRHSLDPNHADPKKYPHMPPHHGDKWPERWTDKGGNKMSEVSACHQLFDGFQHPILKNIGRQFQKNMSAGQKELADGGKGNLEERLTMEERSEWMMSTALK